MITAAIIADSINPDRKRLTTFLLTYPRFIHAEFMTHRVFSRNAASSRAIPIEKMMQAVYEDFAEPEQYGSNKPGMQAGEQLHTREREECMHVLMDLRIDAIKAVNKVSEIGLHKQVANRYLEPWAHITVIATASEAGLTNFFALRAHPMAQPEFQVLAYRMLGQYLASIPKELPWGSWHLPFSKVDGTIGGNSDAAMDRVRQAVGRCARVSYNRQDDEDAAKNIEIHDRCANNGHWSPFEHAAQACKISADPDNYSWSNFDTFTGQGRPSGWQQYRKFFPNENNTTADLAAIMAAKPASIIL